MNFAKTIFALLACVLLMGMQTVSAIAKTFPTQPQVCGCCACNKMDCCVAQPTSNPQSIPVAPARADSQNNFQLIAAIVSLLLPSDQTSVQKVSFPPPAPPTATSVPLYQWNCSYLI